MFFLILYFYDKLPFRGKSKEFIKVHIVLIINIMLSNRDNRKKVIMPLRLLLLTIISIFCTDILVSILIKLLPPVMLWEELLLDSGFLALVLFPALYFFEFRPLIKTIKERDIEEAKSLKSEEKFTKAFVTSPDSVNINRLSDGRYVSINQGFTKILGYTEVDVLGKSSIDLDIWADPKVRDELVRKLKETGSVVNFEADFKGKDGRIINGLMSASIIEFDGEAHILNETKDITHIKKVDKDLEQEKFLVKSLLDYLPDHIYFKDKESRFIRNSKSHADSFGFTDPEQLVGKTDFDFFTEEAARKAFDDEQNIMKTGKPIIVEEKLTRKDKSVVWFSAMKLPLRNTDGEVVGTFGISRDISEQRKQRSSLYFWPMLLRVPVNVFL